MFGFHVRVSKRQIKPWIRVNILSQPEFNQSKTIKLMPCEALSRTLGDGSIVRLATDTEVSITTVFTKDSLLQGLGEEDEESPLDWRYALLLLRDFQINLQVNTKQKHRHVEYVLLVRDFRIWDLQPGFETKLKITDCMEIEDIKSQARIDMEKRFKGCNVIRSLSFISNAEVRAAVGINKNNTYLFASTDILTTGPVQTYDEAEHRAGEKAENETEREAHHAPDEEYTSMGDDNYMEMLEEDGSGDDEEEYDGKRKRKKENSGQPCDVDACSSLPLTQLLEEMACASVTDDIPLSQPDDAGGAGHTSDNAVDRLCQPFHVEDFLVGQVEQSALDNIKEWQTDYIPSPSPVVSAPVSSAGVFDVQAVNTLASNNGNTRDKLDVSPVGNDDAGQDVVVTKAKDVIQEQSIPELTDSQSMVNSSVWQQEMDSVRFSSSDESLDFGSPEAHSTQVNSQRRRHGNRHASQINNLSRNMETSESLNLNANSDLLEGKDNFYSSPRFGSPVNKDGHSTGCSVAVSKESPNNRIYALVRKQKELMRRSDEKHKKLVMSAEKEELDRLASLVNMTGKYQQIQSPDKHDENRSQSEDSDMATNESLSLLKPTVSIFQRQNIVSHEVDSYSDFTINSILETPAKTGSKSSSNSDNSVISPSPEVNQSVFHSQRGQNCENKEQGNKLQNCSLVSQIFSYVPLLNQRQCETQQQDLELRRINKLRTLEMESDISLDETDYSRLENEEESNSDSQKLEKSVMHNYYKEKSSPIKIKKENISPIKMTKDRNIVLINKSTGEKLNDDDEAIHNKTTASNLKGLEIEQTTSKTSDNSLESSTCASPKSTFIKHENVEDPVQSSCTETSDEYHESVNIKSSNNIVESGETNYPISGITDSLSDSFVSCSVQSDGESTGDVTDLEALNEIFVEDLRQHKERVESRSPVLNNSEGDQDDEIESPRIDRVDESVTDKLVHGKENKKEVSDHPDSIDSVARHSVTDSKVKNDKECKEQDFIDIDRNSNIVRRSKTVSKQNNDKERQGQVFNDPVRNDEMVRQSQTDSIENDDKGSKGQDFSDQDGFDDTFNHSRTDFLGVSIRLNNETEKLTFYNDTESESKRRSEKLRKRVEELRKTDKEVFNIDGEKTKDQEVCRSTSEKIQAKLKQGVEANSLKIVEVNKTSQKNVEMATNAKSYQDQNEKSPPTPAKKINTTDNQRKYPSIMKILNICEIDEDLPKTVEKTNFQEDMEKSPLTIRKTINAECKRRESIRIKESCKSTCETMSNSSEQDVKVTGQNKDEINKDLHKTVEKTGFQKGMDKSQLTLEKTMITECKRRKSLRIKKSCKSASVTMSKSSDQKIKADTQDIRVVIDALPKTTVRECNEQKQSTVITKDNKRKSVRILLDRINEKDTSQHVTQNNKSPKTVNTKHVGKLKINKSISKKDTTFCIITDVESDTVLSDREIDTTVAENESDSILAEKENDRIEATQPFEVCDFPESQAFSPTNSSMLENASEELGVLKESFQEVTGPVSQIEIGTKTSAEALGPELSNTDKTSTTVCAREVPNSNKTPPLIENNTNSVSKTSVDEFSDPISNTARDKPSSNKIHKTKDINQKNRTGLTEINMPNRDKISSTFADKLTCSQNSNNYKQDSLQENYDLLTHENETDVDINSVSQMSVNVSDGCLNSVDKPDETAVRILCNNESSNHLIDLDIHSKSDVDSGKKRQTKSNDSISKSDNSLEKLKKYKFKYTNKKEITSKTKPLTENELPHVKKVIVDLTQTENEAESAPVTVNENLIKLKKYHFEDKTQKSQKSKTSILTENPQNPPEVLTRKRKCPQENDGYSVEKRLKKCEVSSPAIPTMTKTSPAPHKSNVQLLKERFKYLFPDEDDTCTDQDDSNEHGKSKSNKGAEFRQSSTNTMKTSQPTVDTCRQKDYGSKQDKSTFKKRSELGEPSTKTIKTYEPRKMYIDGHSFGNEVNWMNYEKSPYAATKLPVDKDKRDSNRRQVEAQGSPSAQGKLVYKKVNGYYRYCREGQSDIPNKGKSAVARKGTSSVPNERANVVPSKETSNAQTKGNSDILSKRENDMSNKGKYFVNRQDINLFVKKPTDNFVPNTKEHYKGRDGKKSTTEVNLVKFNETELTVGKKSTKRKLELSELEERKHKHRTSKYVPPGVPSTQSKAKKDDRDCKIVLASKNNPNITKNILRKPVVSGLSKEFKKNKNKFIENWLKGTEKCTLLTSKHVEDEQRHGSSSNDE